jgi:hypothetical protein
MKKKERSILIHEDKKLNDLNNCLVCENEVDWTTLHTRYNTKVPL